MYCLDYKGTRLWRYNYASVREKERERDVVNVVVCSHTLLLRRCLPLNRWSST
jgi:hypothetical protein